MAKQRCQGAIPVALVTLMISLVAPTQASWQALPSPTLDGIQDFWGPSTDCLYAAAMHQNSGVGPVLRWDGTTWVEEDYLLYLGPEAIWGTGPDSIYLAGWRYGRFCRVMCWRGSGTGYYESMGPYLHDIWGSGGEDILVVGNDGLLLRWDGTEWHRRVMEHTLLGIGGAGPDLVIAVGWGGWIQHRESGIWAEKASGTSSTLRSVHCSGPTRAMAVGNGGTILGWDGSTWEPMASGVTVTLNDVRCWPGGALAVGDEGTILHWDGETWEPMVSGTEQDLRAVWCQPDGPAFAAGDGGTILIWRQPGGSAVPAAGSVGMGLLLVALGWLVRRR